MDFRHRLLRLALPLAALALRSEAQGLRGVTRRTPTVVYGQNASQFFAAGGVPLNSPTNVGTIPGSPQGSAGPGLAQQARPAPYGTPGTPWSPGSDPKTSRRIPAASPARTPASVGTRAAQGAPAASRPVPPQMPSAQTTPQPAAARKSPPGPATR